MIRFMTRKAPDYIKFRAESLRAIALTLTIPFGKCAINILFGNWEKNSFFSLITLTISLGLLILAYNIINEATKSLKNTGRDLNE